ncbi:uncharacterized protein PSANT_01509 [Moesziomyces antarcticus]|uniref:Uncharacterized protein n=1 Tax=Pseudozyma antarctica TaxID=84753 RepID=A0A5C3FHJ5_PSEA2|nr:uncharacterized protein PSANT_01509 [Moesziomyces antarcticus]
MTATQNSLSPPPLRDASSVADNGAVPLPPRPHFQDETQRLFSACKQLRLGQMVAVPHFTLLDSMAAVKILDARMDSGMQLPQSQLPESDRLDPSLLSQPQLDFDPLRPLTPADVLWIMDRLLACEAAWHQGSALSQTLYTCLYFHDLKLLSPKHPRLQQSSPELAAHQPQEPLELIYKVLRAFILATVKTIDIAWSELTSRQHLQDGEDYSSDKNGLSLLETTDTGYVIAELQDAIDWIKSQSRVLQKHLAESLTTRLNFRKQMLYAVRLLQAPAEAAPLDVVMHAKFARRNLALLQPSSSSHASLSAHLDAQPSSVQPLGLPDRSCAPSSAAIAAFDPAYNRRLAWCQPLRPISLPRPSDTCRILDNILQELQQVVQVLQQPGFASWKTFFTHRAISYQTDQPMSATPYVRSLFQTAVCDRSMIACRLPLDWITEAFFHEVALVDPLLLRRASRIGRANVEGGSHTLWNAPPPIGQRIHYFTQRVSGQLVQYLSTLSQNRARCKRTMASRLYREWVNISSEASDIGRQLEACLAPGERYIPDSLFAATQHLALEIMSQITLAGFELELYGRGMDRQSMWWLASRIQMEQGIVCTDLRDELSRCFASESTDRRPRQYSATISYLTLQVHLAHALEHMAVSAVLLDQISQRSRRDDAKRTGCWPLSPEDDVAQLELARSVFASRIKWMRSNGPGLGGHVGVQSELQAEDKLWTDHLSFRSASAEAENGMLASKAQENLEAAITNLQQVSDELADPAKHDHMAQGQVRFVSSLLVTARHNQATLQHVSKPRGSGESPVSGLIPGSKNEWVFEHPWFPKWVLSN